MLRINIPLTQDISARFLPWIIGFMVYLAMLALAGALLLNDIAIRWNNNLMGSLTVQIPPRLPERDMRFHGHSSHTRFCTKLSRRSNA